MVVVVAVVVVVVVVVVVSSAIPAPFKVSARIAKIKKRDQNYFNNSARFVSIITVLFNK